MFIEFFAAMADEKNHQKFFKDLFVNRKVIHDIHQDDLEDIFKYLRQYSKDSFVLQSNEINLTANETKAKQAYNEIDKLSGDELTNFRQDIEKSLINVRNYTKGTDHHKSGLYIGKIGEYLSSIALQKLSVKTSAPTSTVTPQATPELQLLQEIIKQNSELKADMAKLIEKFDALTQEVKQLRSPQQPSGYSVPVLFNK